jgi:hypothetical protein
MARTTAKGFYVWDLTTDSFSHTQLAANWDLLDSLLGASASSLTPSAVVPTSGNFAGRLVMLTASDSGFAAWTIIRYDGSAWRAVGPFEILPAVPTAGNYAGRIVILSAADSGFSAWSVIRYDGAAWGVVGGFSNVNTGGGALNIQGLSTGGDVQYTNSARGPILTDRNTGTKYRMFFLDGKLESEVVT